MRSVFIARYTFSYFIGAVTAFCEICSNKQQVFFCSHNVYRSAMFCLLPQISEFSTAGTKFRVGFLYLTAKICVSVVLSGACIIRFCSINESCLYKKMNRIVVFV